MPIRAAAQWRNAEAAFGRIERQNAALDVEQTALKVARNRGICLD
jgi:glutathione synthase/RimK-type ligase-like ATP-grasp enzyme